MDTSKMSQGQMICAVGALILFVSLFVHWGGGQDAFQSFNVVDVVMVIVAIAAAAWAVAPAGGFEDRVPAWGPMIVLAFALAVFGWAAGLELEISGDLGVWLAIIGSLGIAYGVARSVGALGQPTSRPATVSATTPPPPPPPPPPVATE
jgi:hypothetical protein